MTQQNSGIKRYTQWDVENEAEHKYLWIKEADHESAMKANQKLVSDNETFLHEEYSKKIEALESKLKTKEEEITALKLKLSEGDCNESR